jgi:hypothetical protein
LDSVSRAIVCEPAIAWTATSSWADLLTISTGSGTVMKLTALIASRTTNNASPICLLSFSISRYPSSVVELVYHFVTCWVVVNYPVIKVYLPIRNKLTWKCQCFACKRPIKNGNPTLMFSTVKPELLGILRDICIWMGKIWIN